MKQIDKLKSPRQLVLAGVLGLSLSMMACTTMGTGTGSVSPGSAPVAFSWTSKDGGNTGTMTASVDGADYTGPFLQATSAIRSDDVFEPMWYGWRRGWGDWRYYGAPYGTSFATHYSGKVLANLQGPGSARMRCRFVLNDPISGMSGGGQGTCQIAGGRTVDAVFARS